MSLPASYSAILSDLNRDVLRQQPSDPLQYCFNWFSQRLEADRRNHLTAAAALEESQQIQAETTPPPSGKSTSSSKMQQAQQSARKGAPPSLVGQGYQFGGAAPASATQRSFAAQSLGDDYEHPAASPFSEHPPQTVQQQGGQQGPSPFGTHQIPGAASSKPLKTRTSQDRLSTASSASQPSPVRDTFRASSLPFASSSSNTPAAGSSASAKASRLSAQPPQQSQRNQENDDDSGSESEVEDPRDDPNYRPNSQLLGVGAGQGGIPASYNLGRRTSVSAESLDPNANTSFLPKTVVPKSAHQRARIEASISNNLLFRNLDENQHKDVVNAMKEVSVQAGTEVIVQGAVGDFFYVVEEGSFEVWVRGPPTHSYAGPGVPAQTRQGESKKVASYGPGGSFGELALMYNAPRAATVVATTGAVMWALDRVTFRSILMEHTSRKRRMYETFLSEVNILASLEARERAKIADALEEITFEEGEKVVVEGEVGKNFYIIESGRVEVSRRRRSYAGEGGEEVLGTLGKGDYFGELALLNSAPRAATVRAMPGQGRLRVATLGEKAFTRLLGPVIDILQRKAEGY